MGQRGDYSSGEILDIIAQWEKSDKGERLGQFFFNRMDKTGQPFPELFYCESRCITSHLIWNNYLKLS